MLVVELLAFLGIWLFSRLLLQWWNERGKARHRFPPSLPSLPLVGSLPFIRGYNNISNFFMKKSDELGPIFTFKAGNRTVLTLNNREVIEDALVNHSSAFSGRNPFYSEGVVNPNTKGLISMNTTPEWKKYHQLSLSILKQMGFGVKSSMESRILAEVEFITDYVQKQNGESFDPRELAHLSIANIIMNILFGRRQDYNLGMTELATQIKHSFNILDAALDVAPILRFVPSHRNKLLDKVETHQLMHECLRKEIGKSLEHGGNDCFVRRYIESVGEDHDAEQFRFTLRDLAAAGTDTTANTFLWTLIALANNPDIQDRLKAEIDSVVPRNALPSLNDQHKLPFVEATILEIQRWKTLVPLAVPHATLSDTNVSNYFIPAGTLVLVNLYAAHMNPKVWEDANIFRPDRFLDKYGQVIRKECVIPFSVGRRSCFGEILARSELFLILTGLVQRFIIRPPEGQAIIDDNPVEPVSVVLNSKPFNIRLIARD